MSHSGLYSLTLSAAVRTNVTWDYTTNPSVTIHNIMVVSTTNSFLATALIATSRPLTPSN